MEHNEDRLRVPTCMEPSLPTHVFYRVLEEADENYNGVGWPQGKSLYYFFSAFTQAVPSKTLHLEPPLASFHDLMMGGLGLP